MTALLNRSRKYSRILLGNILSKFYEAADICIHDHTFIIIIYRGMDHNLVHKCNVRVGTTETDFSNSLQWCHNGHGGVSNHQPNHCLFNRLFTRRSTKISKLRVTGLCEGNSPLTAEFPEQMASNAENVSIWSRHHVLSNPYSGNWSVDLMNRTTAYKLPRSHIMW